MFLDLCYVNSSFFAKRIFPWSGSYGLARCSCQLVFNVKSVILAPFNASGNHWELLLFYPTARNIDIGLDLHFNSQHTFVLRGVVFL